MPEENAAPHQYNQVEFEMMVDNIKKVIPAQLQLQALHAQVFYRKYMELKAAGFNDQQALDIVKTRPLFE